MEEILKNLYVKIVFLSKKYFTKDPIIQEIEQKYKKQMEALKIRGKEEKAKLKKEKEKEFLAKHIDYNLNNYRLIRYKNKHLNSRCFIIGNGPSLTANDLEKIKGEFSFGCNKIYKIFKDTSWRPTYLFIEDSLAYKNSFNDIKSINCPKFVSDIALDYSSLPLVKNGIKFFDNINYWDLYPEYPPLTVDLTKELFSAYNVGYQMINTAIYMGFKEIYLLGMDFTYDFSITEGIQVKQSDGTVREMFIMKKNDTNHFTNDYIEIGEHLYDTDTKYAKKAFELLENRSKELNIKIYNATRGGQLDVFERINLDTLFN
jgi:hypothetical protein